MTWFLYLLICFPLFLSLLRWKKKLTLDGQDQCMEWPFGALGDAGELVVLDLPLHEGAPGLLLDPAAPSAAAQQLERRQIRGLIAQFHEAARLQQLDHLRVMGVGCTGHGGPPRLRHPQECSQGNPFSTGFYSVSLRAL